MKFSIKEATAKDIIQMHSIRLSVKENSLSDPNHVTFDDYKTFLEKRGKGWVAVVNDDVVGFAFADLQDHAIWALFIHPNYEKKGIGKKLHDTMLEWYFSTERTKVWLSTDPGTQAERFYTKQGWTLTGQLPNGEIKFEMTADEWSNLSR